jgi:hypothetical protein
LVLTIAADELQGGGAFGGPELCYDFDTPSRCSVPTAGAQLNVTVGGGIVSTLSLAAGYANQGSSNEPYIAQSVDNGTTWSSWTAPGSIPSDSFFLTASCGTSLCIAAGASNSTSGPILAQTIDNGVTWSMAALPSFIVNKLEAVNQLASPGILASACNGMECVAVGRDSSFTAAIFWTVNSGGSWSKNTNVYVPAHEWVGTACSSSLCIVTGSDTASGPGAIPLIAQSSIGSGTWTLADLSGTGVVDANLLNGACISDYCTAVGSVLLSTSDAGATWVQYDLSSITPPSSTILLFAAACTSTICVTGGEDSTATYAPPLFLSTDSGSTWSYVDISGTTAVSRIFVF